MFAIGLVGASICGEEIQRRVAVLCFVKGDVDGDDGCCCIIFHELLPPVR